MIPIEYDRDAKCPIWDGFLEETMDGDLDLICFLHRMAGYMLTGSTGEQKMFFLYGTGCNGKSTLLDTLMHVMGDYARPVASDLLMLRREDSHPTALADLQGIRMATCAEVEQGRRMAEVRVKELTGMTSHKSLIKARRMRQDYYEFEATHKLVVCGNHKPIIKGTDEGIWRRMDLIPFNVKITEPDKELPEKLLEEAPGILRWCVRGCGDWRLHGLAEPPAVQDATKTYRTEMDILGEFIVDTCVIDPNAKSTAASLYDEYKQWCVENKEYAMSKRKFGSALKERGFDQRHDGKDRSRTWFGIGLRTDANG
jgi:putative DNA primase/helicase